MRLPAPKGKHKAIFIDVLDKAKVQAAADEVITEYGQVDILINGAGGNNPKATTSPHNQFFDIPADAVQFVFNLNIVGAILPSQVFGKMMVENKEGIILNISSMNAFRPLTRIPAYSAAKAESVISRNGWRCTLHRNIRRTFASMPLLQDFS